MLFPIRKHTGKKKKKKECGLVLDRWYRVARVPNDYIILYSKINDDFVIYVNGLPYLDTVNIKKKKNTFFVFA